MNHIKLYKPHLNQLPVHNACNDNTTFFITLNAGRQSGKTALAQQQAIYWAGSLAKKTIYWVSPTQGQTSKVYKQILEMIVETPLIKSHKGSMGDTEIVFSNNSIIKFRSSAQEDSLRGETIEYLIIDEAAFVKESVFQEILLPMLNVRGKKCLIISTPKGKNWFFYQYQRGMKANEKIYKSFKFTSLDNPYSNKSIIKIAEENLPSVLFSQEYLGEFVDNAAIFENINELANINIVNKPIPGAIYFIGVDIALKDDYTVINVLDKDSNVVWYERYNQITSPQLKENLIKCFELWKPKKILIEENNQGLPIIHDLKITHKVPNIEGFKTTSTSKQEIINNLINAFASKKIRVPNDADYKSELEVFSMTISPTGTPKFSAPAPFHDDIVMSLAIAWECSNKFKYNGTYNFN